MDTQCEYLDMSGQGRCSVRPQCVLKLEDISYNVVFVGTNTGRCNNAGGGVIKCDDPDMESSMTFLWPSNGS